MSGVNKNTITPPNPTGKGGFADNPQNRNPGGRPKNQQSFTYWMNYFKNLTNTEFKQWKKVTPKEEQYMAALIAYERISNAQISVKEFEQVADRTEGKAPQSIDLTTKGESLNEYSDEQVRRIAERVARRGNSSSNTSV